MKTAFNSNSFAAYRRKALKDVGGFPINTILSEDMYVTAKMLLKIGLLLIVQMLKYIIHIIILYGKSLKDILI